MPATPTSDSASRTSSSLNGLMIAMTIFIALTPPASGSPWGGQHNGCGILRRVGDTRADGRSRDRCPRWWPDTGDPMNATLHYGNRQPDPMIDLGQLDELARRLSNLVPPAVREGREELQQNFKSVLQAGLGNIDMCNSEEFDSQRA